MTRKKTPQSLFLGRFFKSLGNTGNFQYKKRYIKQFPPYNRSLTPVPTAESQQQAPTSSPSLTPRSSCAREWVTFCDNQASVAAEHFFKNICDSLLTTTTSSSLPEDVTANHVLQRYVETFAKSIETHLQEKTIRNIKSAKFNPMFILFIYSLNPPDHFISNNINITSNVKRVSLISS